MRLAVISLVGLTVATPSAAQKMNAETFISTRTS